MGHQSVKVPGDLDEVRLWDVVGTQSDIVSNKAKRLAGNEAGLMA